MNRFSLILIFAALIATAACSSTKNTEVVDFSGIGVSSDSQNGEIRFDNLSDITLSDWDASKAGKTETFEANDNSTVTVMWDKYGNKTEVRTFTNHPRLTSVHILTGANGTREAFIHGRSGETVNVSQELLGKLLSAPADELANAAKIYQTFPQEDFIYTQKPPESAAKLKPLPSSEFQINNQKTEPAPVQESEAETEQPTDTVKQKSTEKGSQSQYTDKEKPKNVEEF